MARRASDARKSRIRCPAATHLMPRAGPWRLTLPQPRPPRHPARSEALTGSRASAAGQPSCRCPLAVELDRVRARRRPSHRRARIRCWLPTRPHEVAPGRRCARPGLHGVRLAECPSRRLACPSDARRAHSSWRCSGRSSRQRERWPTFRAAWAFTLVRLVVLLHRPASTRTWRGPSRARVELTSPRHASELRQFRRRPVR